MSAATRATSFGKNEIDLPEAQRLLALEEGHYVDLKQIDIRPGKLTEFISAFANTSGGEIFLGIGEIDSPAGKLRFWKGFEDMEAANGHIQAIDALSPLGNHYQASFIIARHSLVMCCT